MIKDFEKQDIDMVMKLWLDTNISAHYFIEKKYWIENFNDVKNMILNASIYVYEESDIIVGFIGLMDNYIAGIFVLEKCQSKGIGEHLLDYVKSKHSQLSLDVYKKNVGAVRFYIRQGFFISKETVDIKTGEVELKMNWEDN